MSDSKLSRLGKYEIRATLGRGAMGTVYEGWDPIIARRVAIKTVALPDPADAEAQEELGRFRREAQAAGRLTHPNIVGVFDYGETDALAYIVMEFVDGRTWKSVLDGQERLPVSEVVRVMGEMLAGLQYSHEQGVVHRDIKPANLIQTRQGQTKIADFGIARIESSSMTQAGTVMGTPAYMSPEQFMGQTVDARTDIYSAGVVLFQLLTGERPFEGSMTAIMHKALNTQPPKPSDLSVTAPVAFDAVVSRAMAKRPADRYPTAAAFAEAIRAALEAPAAPLLAPQPMADADATVVAAPPPRAAPAAPPAPAPVATAATGGGGGRMKLIAAGAAAVLVIAGGGGAWLATRGGSPAPAPAEQHASSDAGGAGSGATAGAGTGTDTTAAASGPVAPATPVVTATAQPPAPAMLAPALPAPALQAAPAPVAPVIAASLPAVPPVPTPAPPPVVPVVTQQPAPPPRSPEETRQAIAAALAGVGCTLTQVAPAEANTPGGIVVSGFSGKEGPEAALLRAASDADSTAPVSWRLATFTGPYCGVLDVLRPLGPGFYASPSGVKLALANDRTRLQENDLIIPRITVPEFPAYLQVDYFGSDGSVFHMHHATPDGSRPLPAGSRQTLGEPAKGFNGWEVGEPFGRDMIVAVAASAPLFSQTGGPESEPAAHYLPELQAAMDSARKRGVRLSGAVLLLDTERKP